MKLLGIFAFGALLIVAFGYVSIFGGPTGTEIVPATDNALSTDATARDTQPADLPERESFAGAGSIESLYNRNQNLECQITYIPNPLEAEISGNMFIADERVRADFVVPAPDLTGQSVASIIYDTATLYIWSEIDGQLFGVKQDQSEFTGFGDSSAAIDYTTQIQYDCLTWPAVDNTIFLPPTNVLFGDMADATANMEFGIIYEDEDGELPL